MRRFVEVIAAVLALCFSSHLVEADTKTFSNPMIGGNRLDWCVNWGTGCGEPAATAWCESIGYHKSIDSEEAVDIGASTPTRLIATGVVCDQAYCDGFASITCATAVTSPSPPLAPAPATPPPLAAEIVKETFNNPIHKGARLNWCFSGKNGYGKKVADAWCGGKGFSKALSFKIATKIGPSKPTIYIGNGKATKKQVTNGFSRITCVK